MDRLQLHVDEQRVHFGAVITVEDHARHGDHQTERRVVERYRDAVGEHERVAALRRLRSEDLDHADDGAEQTEQRGDRGDGAEARQKALELDRDRTACLLNGLFVTAGVLRYYAVPPRKSDREASPWRDG